MGDSIAIKLNHKFTFYLSVFLNFYLHIIHTYRVNAFIGKLIIKDTPAKKCLYVKIFRTLL